MLPYTLASRPNADLQTLFEKRYAAEPFVDVMPAGSHPETRSVRGSNRCRIAVHRPQDGDTVVVLSAIDNLVKGAAGQAVQNMNIMFGLPEETALNVVPLCPRVLCDLENSNDDLAFPHNVYPCALTFLVCSLAIAIPFILALGGVVWWAYDSGLELAGFHRGQAVKELDELRESVVVLREENARLSSQAAAFERQAQMGQAANEEIASQN